MSPERSAARKKQLAASNWDQSGSLDDWVAELRRLCLDNLQRSRMEGRRATLRDRLFPLSSNYALQFRDVLYSESVWAASTLAICYGTYSLSTRDLAGALAFTLVASVVMLPLLVVWAGLGYYYVRKRNRKSLG